jgi:hypothetical protein
VQKIALHRVIERKKVSRTVPLLVVCRCAFFA